MARNSQRRGPVGLWEPSTAMRRCRIAVARAFGVTPWALVGPDRADRLCRARQAMLWVLKARWPKMSRSQLGHMMSVEDSSTVIHALRRADEQRATDMVFHAFTQALAEQRPVPAPAAPLRSVKPKNEMQADDRDAARRSAASHLMIAALRREHPERFEREAA